MRRVNRGERARLRLTLNGRKLSGEAEPRMLLTDFIRHEIGATGTHVGCEHGICGACTIRVDGKAIRACLMLAVQANGKRIDTIEGLAAADGTLSPLQVAFHRNFALQCGIAADVFRILQKPPVIADGAQHLTCGLWGGRTCGFQLTLGLGKPRVQNQLVRFRQRFGGGEPGGTRRGWQRDEQHRDGPELHGRLVRSCCFSVCRSQASTMRRSSSSG